jgi:error-prone DNA polymerase
MYIELHARSAFSFLEGATLPEDLISACAHHHMPAMALLDRDGVYGSPRFYLAAEHAGLKAHIGAEVSCEALQEHRTFSPQRHRGTEKNKKEKTSAAEKSDLFKVCHSERSEGPAFSPRTSLASTNLQSNSLSTRYSALSTPDGDRIPLLVSSRAGYQNLCQLITRMKLRAQRKEEGAVLEHELEQHAPGLICLTGGDEGPLAAALKQGGPAEAHRVIDRLTGIFGRNNVYVELQRHFHREEESRNRVALEIARDLRLPLLATNGVCYATQRERELCDVLTAIRHHHTLMTAGRLLARNSERHLKSPEEMSRLFADLPEAIANTVELSTRLEFKLSDLGYEFPRYPVPEGETMMSFLRQRVDEGARWRYGISLSGDRVPQSFHNKDLQQRARRQIERELQLIERLDLAGYFLIVWDIVRFCREQNILAQGRGSAANSAVCYSLGITAVDPVGMELLFERFLSEERGEWPDIDIDLPSGDQRERVIQHIYQRYGQRGAAMTANVITYRNRMAAREMGKAMGFDPETLNKISSAVTTWEYKDANDALDRRFHDAGLDLNHPRLRKYFELCVAVRDLPRHLGQHSGGMVICQGQLDSVVPLEPASMPGRVVVQWDKEDCADMKIIKVDLLGLGMMAVLEDSIQLIRNDYHEEVDLAHLPPDDPKVYATLQKADTVGMFQIESRAQMSCLPRLRPKKFYDIVVQVAIIRPGPIVGQMVNPFLQRRQGREAVSYPHPSLEPVLARTMGVPLFQEQLLRIAMISANFTGGEAEELRRAMGFKRSQARMKEIEAKLRDGMTRNGIAQEAQEQIILSITSFALYGFPESHAASFALIAYASAWLKCHYLGAFTAALLNNQPMGFYHPATIVKDAQRHGLKILPVDVMKSDWLCTLEPVAESVVGRQSSVVGKDQFSAPSSQFSVGDQPSAVKPSISYQPSAISEKHVVSRRSSVVGENQFSVPSSQFSVGDQRSAVSKNASGVVIFNRFIAGQGFGPPPETFTPTVSAPSKSEAISHKPSANSQPTWDEIGSYTRHNFIPAAQRQNQTSPLSSIPEISIHETSLKVCHPERSEGPAFLSRSAPRPANSSSEITDQKLSNSPSLNPDVNEVEGACPERAEGCFCKEKKSLTSTLALRLGLNYVRGLRESAAQALVRERSLAPFQSIHDLTRRVPELRKDELTTLAEIGALNSIGNSPQSHRDTETPNSHSQFEIPEMCGQYAFSEKVLNSHFSVPLCLCGEKIVQLKPETGNSKLPSKLHRRDALWQVEKAVRRSGPLLEQFPEPDSPSPLAQMTYEERLVADFHGTGLTVGPHPMSYRRAEMKALGIRSASELESLRSGLRLRIGGCVIARQRPGTAKGFVFLSIEDETGIANAIVHPDLVQKNRILLVSERFLMIEGILQNQDNVISVRAERVLPLSVTNAETNSHDFH